MLSVHIWLSVSVLIIMASNITEDEHRLLESFKALKLKPKADTPEELSLWLQDIGHKTIKDEVPASGMSMAIANPLRLSICYGDVNSLIKGEATYDQRCLP